MGEYKCFHCGMVSADPLPSAPVSPSAVGGRTFGGPKGANELSGPATTLTDEELARIMLDAFYSASYRHETPLRQMQAALSAMREALARKGRG